MQTLSPTAVTPVTRPVSPMSPYAMLMPSPISAQRVAFLEGRGIDCDIAAIDLEMVKVRLGEPKEGLGWNPEQCEDAELEYKRYLMLCRKFHHPHHSIVPNRVMDTMWHYHILDTRAYCADCDKWNGGYFHHFPYFGLRGDEDAKQLKASFEETKRHYAETFGESMVRGGIEGSDWGHEPSRGLWSLHMRCRGEPLA